MGKVKLPPGRPKKENKKITLTFSIHGSVLSIGSAKELTSEQYSVIKQIAENAVRLSVIDGTFNNMVNGS